MEIKNCISKKIVIHANADKVFGVLADIENWNLWTKSINSISLPENSKFEQGGKVMITQPKLYPAIWTITELKPNQEFVWQTKTLGVTITASHSLESTPDGTIVELKTIYQGLLSGLLFKLSARLTNQYMTMEINGLKAECEKRLN